MSQLEEAIQAIVDERIGPAVDARLAEMKPVIHDEEAESITRKLQRINAKQFITINEFQFLFGCSRGYVDKLLEQASKSESDHPVPYCDLNGLCVFDRLKVLKWAEGSKQLRPGQKKAGGRKSHLKQVVNQ